MTAPERPAPTMASNHCTALRSEGGHCDKSHNQHFEIDVTRTCGIGISENNANHKGGRVQWKMEIYPRMGHDKLLEFLLACGEATHVNESRNVTPSGMCF